MHGLVLHSNAGIQEVSRGIRFLLDELLKEVLGEEENQVMNAMRLGLSHSLSRYKLKFSPDKVDTMIVQAIGLLDDLDKEINTYAMRLKEWFGWHFPELRHVVNDNLEFAKIVQIMKKRVCHYYYQSVFYLFISCLCRGLTTTRKWIRSESG